MAGAGVRAMGGATAGADDAGGSTMAGAGLAAEVAADIGRQVGAMATLRGTGETRISRCDRVKHGERMEPGVTICFGYGALATKAPEYDVIGNSG